MSSPARIGIVAGTFHTQDLAKMINSARQAAFDLDLTIVAEVEVPGSYEKPLAAKRLLLRDDVDGLVILGIIEKGETAHGLVMGQVIGAAFVALQLEFMKPIGIGILGPEIFPTQIPSRLESYSRAAVSAVSKMLN